MAESPSVKFLGLLRLLLEHEVEFLVVGGVAAYLEGAAIVTSNLEILYHKTPENLDRLLATLGELKARYRDPAGGHIEPDRGKLETLRLHLLLTDLGPLDVLATIGTGFAYPDLVDRTVWYELREFRVRVLEQAAVIETKEQANREKDRAVLPILRQVLALKTAERSEGGGPA